MKANVEIRVENGKFYSAFSNSDGYRYGRGPHATADRAKADAEQYAKDNGITLEWVKM